MKLRALIACHAALLICAGWPGVAANAQSTSVQYDYDALGRVCRARYQGGQTINYLYDTNGNRREVDQKTTGGVTNSAECPMVAATAAPTSTARARSNNPPTVSPNLDVTLCVTQYTYACPVQRVNVLRYAFDWDFQGLTVISTAMQSGPGSVTIPVDGKSIQVTPPSSATNGTAAQVIYTVSDGAGGTATGYVNITYVNF